MDDLLEFLFEVIFSGMVEGIEDKKVPRYLRILFLVIFSAAYLGVVGLFIYLAVISSEVVVKYILISISVLMLIFLAIYILKQFKKSK